MWGCSFARWSPCGVAACGCSAFFLGKWPVCGSGKSCMQLRALPLNGSHGTLPASSNWHRPDPTAHQNISPHQTHIPPIPRWSAPCACRPGMSVEITALSDVLRERFGLESFRPGQEDIIRAVLDGRDTLAVMPTGSGKSLVYQLPALLLDGLTVVVSPLIALMKDQTDKLKELGVDCLTINSGLTARQQAEAAQALADGQGDILYVTPERFRDRDFFETLLQRRVALFVIDEAHCVSQWGHDFRPDYMMLGSIAERLGRPPVMALTATTGPHSPADAHARSLPPHWRADPAQPLSRGAPHGERGREGHRTRDAPRRM
jgi:hypothetical protein